MHSRLQISLNGINLNVINKLIKKLNKIKNIKYIDNFNNSLNIKDIDPYYLLYSNKILDKQQEILYLHKKYLILNEIKQNMFDTFRNNPYYLPFEANILLNNINDVLLRHNNRILEHNKALKLPVKGKHKKEVEKLLDWFGFNTPSTKSLYVTPLHGTDYFYGIDNESSSDIYNQWKVSTFMLILEYNYLIKAWIYLNNKKSSVLSNEFKESYDFWKKRQIIILNDTFDFLNLKKDLGILYIPPLWLDGDYINREIAEDILYVLLNILLAKSILTKTKVNNYINNDKLFFKELEAIISKHYIKYNIEYQCLYSLRRYKCYNFMSLEQLNLINEN